MGGLLCCIICLFPTSSFVYMPYMGHSFHQGGATYAFWSGVPGELIQVMVHWNSDASMRYFDFSSGIMFSVSSRMRDSIV